MATMQQIRLRSYLKNNYRDNYKRTYECGTKQLFTNSFSIFMMNNPIHGEGIEVDKTNEKFYHDMERFFDIKSDECFYSQSLILKELKKARRDYREWINRVYLSKDAGNFCHYKNGYMCWEYSSNDKYKIVGLEGSGKNLEDPFIVINFGECKRTFFMNYIIQAMTILGCKESHMMVYRSKKQRHLMNKKDFCSSAAYMIKENKEFNMDDDLCVICPIYLD